jgi:hypothetical protein
MFLGNCFHVEALLNSGERVVAEVPRIENGFAPGDAVHAWWNPSEELRVQ